MMRYQVTFALVAIPEGKERLLRGNRLWKLHRSEVEL